jgi:hypothetical protein
MGEHEEWRVYSALGVKQERNKKSEYPLLFYCWDKMGLIVSSFIRGAFTTLGPIIALPATLRLQPCTRGYLAHLTF